MLYEKYLSVIDEKSDLFCGVSDDIWDHPETSFEEYYASDLLTRILEENGFSVTRGLCGIPTAFKASYGDGTPRLGILAEYDALDGFSQVGECAEKRSIPGKSKAHGCGHNLFAGGSYAKRAMLYAGKAVAGTLIRLLEDPALLAKAKAEHRAKIGNGYVCGLPEGLKPTVPERY